MSEKSVFTKVRQGELPGEVLLEEDNLFVMMTIAPHSPGHCLIIPTDQVSNFEDVPAEVFARMMLVAQQLGRVLKRLYASPKVAMIAAGMEVEHTHIHLFPLHQESDISFSAAKHPPMTEITAEADKIRAALKDDPIV
jgi:diadenosine tetraphosphate (Ap4A) HIT family hydrolase